MISNVALILFLGISGCTEVIDIELDSTYQRLIVFGSVSTDSTQQQVDLSTSSDYFSNTPAPKISLARVELRNSNSSIVLKEHDTIPGRYLTPAAYQGVPLSTYSLHISEIDVDGDGELEEYEAESTMPAIPVLDSIGLLYFQSPFISGYQVLMYASDPPTREWYGYKLQKNQFLLTEKLSDYTVQSDDFFNGTYVYGLPVGFLSDDNPEEAVLPGDTVTFELQSITQEYYNFVVDAQLEIVGNNPLFSGPSSNVRSNISNEGKGVFSAYSIARISVIIPTE
jgi:hypothetical protein